MDDLDRLIAQLITESPRAAKRAARESDRARSAIASAKAAIKAAEAAGLRTDADLASLRANLSEAERLLRTDPAAARAKALGVAADARRLPLRLAAQAWAETSARFVWQRWRCQCGATGEYPAADHLLVRRESKRRSRLAVELPDPSPRPGLPVVWEERPPRQVSVCPECAPRALTQPEPIQLTLF